jgi:hypothetical protein
VQAVIAHAEDSSVVSSPNRQKAKAPSALMLATFVEYATVEKEQVEKS